MSSTVTGWKHGTNFYLATFVISRLCTFDCSTKGFYAFPNMFYHIIEVISQNTSQYRVV